MPAFRLAVTDADGGTAAGTCSEEHALQLLRSAVRRGYRAEATRQGGVIIVRDVWTGGFVPKHHTVTLEPARAVGTLTATMRRDLEAIGRRASSHLDHRTGRISAGLYSIPPAAAARLTGRGLVTVASVLAETPAVTVSLVARLAMLAQDHRTETSKPRGYHRKEGVSGPWRKGSCVYDRSSVASCSCRWSHPCGDRDDARRKAAGHRQQVTAEMIRGLPGEVLVPGRPGGPCPEDFGSTAKPDTLSV